VALRGVTEGRFPRFGLPAVLVTALLFTLPFRAPLTDDSYAHFQFAKQLLRGQGFAFTPGEAPGGVGSPLWVLLLSGIGRLVPSAAETPLDPSTVPALARIATALGLAAHLASIVVLARLGRRLGWPSWAALATAALFAVDGWLARWAPSGIESALAVLLVVLAIDFLAAALLEGKSPLRAGVALGLAVLTRPECAVLAALAGVAIRIGSEAARARRVLAFIAGVSSVTVPWMLLASLAFREFPSVAGVSTAFRGWDAARAADSVRHALADLLSSSAPAVACCVAALAFAPLGRLLGPSRGRRAFWLLLAAWPVLLFALVAVGGAALGSRSILPAVPCVLLLGVASVRWAGGVVAPRIRPLLPAGILALAAAQNGVFVAAWVAPEARADAVALRSSLGRLGTWARESTSPGTRFAMAEVGAFAFHSDRPVLDLSGRRTPAMAPIVAREGYAAVVDRVLFEQVGHPSYLIDRAREPGRLVRDADPAIPYRLVLTREGERREGRRSEPIVYSLYAIDWSVYERTNAPRVAGLRSRDVAGLGSGAPVLYP